MCLFSILWTVESGVKFFPSIQVTVASLASDASFLISIPNQSKLVLLLNITQELNYSCHWLKSIYSPLDDYFQIIKCITILKRWHMFPFLLYQNTFEANTHGAFLNVAAADNISTIISFMGLSTTSYWFLSYRFEIICLLRFKMARDCCYHS